MPSVELTGDAAHGLLDAFVSICSLRAHIKLGGGFGLVRQQRTSLEVKQIACALAVLVPLETAAALLHRWFDLSVAPGAVWDWVQAAGQCAMERLRREWAR